MKTDSAKKFLSQYAKKADLIIDDFFQKEIKNTSSIGEVPSGLIKKIYLLAKKGKKLRGALVVLGYQLAKGADLEAIYDLSIFIEIFHTGILIHDDILDDCDTRRGTPTIHTQYRPLHYGQSMAICAGDLAFYLSWEKLLAGKFPHDRLIQASKVYADYIKRVIDGQVLDINNDKLSEVSDKEIINIFRYKTAEYTGVLPLLIGAILAGTGNQVKLDALKEYGLALGWAFQIRDDILGVFGDEKITGKPVGSDLSEGKITLLILHLLRHGTFPQINYIKSILGRDKIDGRELAKVKNILKEAGSYDYVLDLGKQYLSKGMKAIAKITNDPKSSDILKSILIYVFERIN